MAKYEMLYALNNDLTDEAKDAKIEKYESIVKNMNGAIVSTEKWGAKKFAYPIKFKNEGYYVLMTFEAEGNVLNELDRIASIDSDLLRRMTTKLN
ncbi:MAG: 30S ribosomal protein S6 [Clostridia bacterium]|nr:30S ribosomal protein S6 [Clostridia bacterium]